MQKIQTTSVWGVYKETRGRAPPLESLVYGQRQSPDAGGPTQNEEEPRSYGTARATSISRNDEEVIGINGQPIPARASVNRSDIPVGQPPAKVSAVPGKSGSSEVFRTQTGQVLDQTDDDEPERAGKNTLIETPDATKFVKYEGGYRIDCVATDTSLRATFKKNDK